MGSGNPAQIHSPRRAECLNPETIRMAYFPAHVLDSAAERRDRVQGDAGVVAPFLVAIYVGCLHAGDLARKTCGAGSRARPGIRS